jgi:cytochrome oxidase Cu insertion factor (SCO1/SenC/PrrC family)
MQRGGIRFVSRTIAAGAVMAVLGAAHPARAEAPREEAARFMGELMSGKAHIGAPFTLVDPQGRRRSLADFRGKVVLLYFGYTSCADVCPADLLQIAKLLASLGHAADGVVPVFVTLDPARDTPEVLEAYAGAFSPRIVALRGSEEDTRRIANAYKVYFAKVDDARSGTYFIDHMAFTFLLDRAGDYAGFFPPGTSSERMRSMMDELIPPE